MASGNCIMERLPFRKKIDRETSKELPIRLVGNNHASDKHAEVKAWLQAHPIHTFTRTSHGPHRPGSI
jgi:hypothetical protein